ncbi:MAG: PQQ-dependent sugar dehydrogenase [Acidimicrobiales bacterium]|nr:PQQ-dependent sugar dehydrogenase [Acidimicrobiales bacterium]
MLVARGSIHRWRTAVTAAITACAVALAASCGGDKVTQASNEPGGDDVVPIERDASLTNIKLALQPIAQLEQPVDLAPRAGTDDLYVIEQKGKVRRIEVRDGAYRVVPEPVLDLRGVVSLAYERGLLGLTFSPDGNLLYVYYTGEEGKITVDEYRMDGDRADRATRRNLLSLDHPRPNHNGGSIAFGPDGMLYLGVGDGGGAGDPDKNGQNTTVLLGKILRIDPAHPSNGKAYGIPAGNPFADGSGAPEIWAYGLRNPWRFSFDRETGDLWIGDVGQNAVEEIDFAPAGPDGTGAGRGLNFGWSLMEGSKPFQGGSPPPDHTPPIFDYEWTGDTTCTVIGGYVYRGEVIPELRGTYLFADLCGGQVRGLRQRDGKLHDERPLGAALADPGPTTGVTSFGQDGRGELYLLSLDGNVYKIVSHS